MRTFTVRDLKTNFSEILAQVRLGEQIAITFGKKKEIIAYIVPRLEQHRQKRTLGLLKGKASIHFSPDSRITDAELLGR